MRDSDLEDDPQRAHTPQLSEQTIADAIVDVVCRCGASGRVNFPTNIHYGCVDCGSLNHTAGSVWCKS